MSRAENPTYTPVRRTTSGIVKTGAGCAGGFLVASGTTTLTLYDGTDNTGTIIVNGLVTVAGTFYPLPVQFTKGLYATMTGAGDITFNV